MTKIIGGFSLSCIAGSCLLVTQYNVVDILGGWCMEEGENAKCLITEHEHAQGNNNNNNNN